MPLGIRRLLAFATRIGSDPRDSSEARLQKALLVVATLMVLPPGLIWGALYWVFGERIPALFPWAFVVVLSVCVVIFSATGSFRFLRDAELTLILVTPFLLLLSLGGLVPSSGVILWSFLGPLGAITFDRPRRAWMWFGAFLALLVVGIPLAPAVRSSPVAFPDDLLRAFAALNIGGVALISFALLAMFAGQREAARRRVEDLLLNILPEEIARRLQEERQTIADHVGSASILFADVVDFTPLSSRLSPAEVVGLLDRLFTDFDELADAHGVEKIKTIGDSYMVAAGVPRPRPDHAHALVGMAIGMHECMSRYARADGSGALQLRIGINSGPVIAGVIGRRRFLYDLWGDAVNITRARRGSSSATTLIARRDVSLT